MKDTADASLAERAFKRVISKAKANGLLLVHRVWTGFWPFSRQNQTTKAIALWYLADHFACESTLKKVVPLT